MELYNLLSHSFCAHAVKKVTEKGRVPLQPKVYLERKGLIEKIRNELRKMANGDT